MENFYYFQIIRKLTIQFLDILNGISVAKYDSDGNILKYVQVPLKLASKQKYYYWLVERKHELRFPMMAVSMSSINYNQSRKNNRKIKINIDNFRYQYNPTPYDINYEVNISALYVNEIYQIIEQIIPFFDPYIMIKLHIPEINNIFDVKILLESISLDQNLEIPEDEYRLINWILSFTVQGEFLRPIKYSKNINEIFLQFKNYDLYNKNSIEGNELYETIHLSGGITEELKKLYKYEILNDFSEYEN